MYLIKYTAGTKNTIPGERVRSHFGSAGGGFRFCASSSFRSFAFSARSFSRMFRPARRALPVPDRSPGSPGSGFRRAPPSAAKRCRRREAPSGGAPRGARAHRRLLLPEKVAQTSRERSVAERTELLRQYFSTHSLQPGRPAARKTLDRLRNLARIHGDKPDKASSAVYGRHIADHPPSSGKKRRRD